MEVLHPEPDNLRASSVLENLWSLTLRFLDAAFVTAAPINQSNPSDGALPSTDVRTDPRIVFKISTHRFILVEVFGNMDKRREWIKSHNALSRGSRVRGHDGCDEGLI